MGITGLMQLLTRLILYDEFAVDASAVTFSLYFIYETRRKMVSLPSKNRKYIEKKNTN